MLITIMIAMCILPLSAFAADVSSTKTISDLLEDIGIEISPNSTIELVVPHNSGVRTMGETYYETNELVVTEAVNASTFVQQRLVLLDEERDPALITIAASSTESESFSDNTITVDSAFPIYGDSAYRYVVTYGTTYTLNTDKSSNHIYLVKPQSVFVRASSYSTTTHNISYVDIGLSISGYEYDANLNEIQFGAYYVYSATQNNPVSGRTYTFSCASDYASEYGNWWIGCQVGLPTATYVVSYTIVFDDGEEVANTGYLYS